MSKHWRLDEFKDLLNGVKPHGRSEGAYNSLREAIKDYEKGGKFGNSALSGWMKDFLDKLWDRK